MSPADALRDPRVSPAVAWAALKKLLGASVADWEPDAIALDLERHGVPPAASLMTKLLAAQTLVNTGSVVRDHEALFAFALACDGIPHGYDEFAHPTPDQLAWAVHQIEALAKRKLTDEEGFDPDEIDPAIAVLLFDAGWFLAPSELSFAQPVLDKLSHADEKLVSRCKKAWNALDGRPNMHEVAEQLPEDAAGVQLRRLADASSYVREHADHEASLSRGLALADT
jgi:hypothetical protein